MNYSPDCENLTKESEELRLVAYDDAQPDKVLQEGDEVLGTLTIGWGHTGPEVRIGLVWTIEQCQSKLTQNLQSAAGCVSSLVTATLTQGQFDALTDFAFNLGCGELKTSTLLRVLNLGNYTEACRQLYWVDDNNEPHGWIKSGGKVLAGLVTRRQKEQALWNS